MANAASSVTSSGNLDVNSIVRQLVAVERQPIDKLNLKEASYQAQLTSYGTIKGALSSFETAVSDLNSIAKFQTLKATSSDDKVISATVSSIASPGSYTLEVTDIAQAQSLVAQGLPSTTAAIGSGAETTLTFDFGTISNGTLTNGFYIDADFTGNGSNSHSITINSSNNTLSDIRDAINEANMGVTATIINDGDATNPYRLVLASDSLGASNSMKISVSSADGDLSLSNLLAYDPGVDGGQNLAETVTASNANFRVNGLLISKESNSVSDVIHGVTLNLLKETEIDTPVKLTVARDTSSISTSVASLVKAYNDLAGILKTETSYDVTSQKGATLQGDSTIRSVQSQLRNLLGSAVSGTSGALNTISDVGVSFQKDGTLKLDQTKLDTAMKDNFNDIALLFSSDNGLLTKLNTFTTSALASNGILANRTDGIGRTIADIKQRAAEMETRLLSVEKRYRAQFTSLDSLLNSMNNTSVYLTQQLAQISNNN
ncbi:MAG: flagellar filament capping protein FliD [Gallionella sp.]|nr:flagellar filament capping protein FliD [Gallionella sp.]